MQKDKFLMDHALENNNDDLLLYDDSLLTDSMLNFS